MALVTANGSPVLDTALFTPRWGAWHVDLHVDSLEQLIGAVTIDVDSGAMVLKGTAVPARTGEYLDVARVRVLAGAGGTANSARPRRYRSTTVGTILRDLLRDAGEQLDPTAEASTLARQVPDWTTRANPVGQVLGELLAIFAPGAGWRMTAAGTMWVGVDAWPAASVPDGTFELVDDAFEESSARVLLDAPAMLAGTTFLGRRVSYAQTRVAPTGPVEADLWFELGGVPGEVDRLKAALRAIVRATPPKLDPRSRFWARVVQQAGGTIHVVADDGGVGDLGDVALALGPGDSVSGMTGGRVLLGWTADGAAVAHGFQGGTPSERVIDAGATFVGGKLGAEPPPLGTSLLTYLTTIAAAINAIAPGSVQPPTPALLAKKTNVA
ncbi:MAG: hypothetical protein V4537_14475 [Pseudomonadota bacterium]